MRTLTALCLGLFLFITSAASQESTPETPPDPYKPTLDRLQSLTTLEVPDWRFHTDVPHPEDPNLNDSDWQVVNLHQPWETGPRVLRRTIEIPDKINGYATQGARVQLEFVVHSKDALLLTIFSNGGIVYRGDEDMQQPIPLTQNAQPGQKFLISVRINCAAVETSISDSKLVITPQTRPDPGFVRMEIMSAEPMVAAYPEGKAQRQQQLDAAVKAIDFSTLDLGDQNGFDNSLKQAQTNLLALRPWLQQFKIHAVGNSH